MESRTLNNLFLLNEDYHYDGDLTIKGDVSIKNGNITVSGVLAFDNPHASISIIGGNISADVLCSNSTIIIRDGDIIVNELDTSSIDSDGNIEVTDFCSTGHIKCLNYLVSCDNFSDDITAMQDIYILGSNESRDIDARDILIDGDNESTYIKATQNIYISGSNNSLDIEAYNIQINGDCCLNNSSIIAKSFECSGNIKDCSSMSVR